MGEQEMNISGWQKWLAGHNCEISPGTVSHTLADYVREGKLTREGEVTEAEGFSHIAKHLKDYIDPFDALLLYAKATDLLDELDDNEVLAAKKVAENCQGPKGNDEYLLHRLAHHLAGWRQC